VNVIGFVFAVLLITTPLLFCMLPLSAKKPAQILSDFFSRGSLYTRPACSFIEEIWMRFWRWLLMFARCFVLSCLPRVRSFVATFDTLRSLLCHFSWSVGFTNTFTSGDSVSTKRDFGSLQPGFLPRKPRLFLRRLRLSWDIV